MPDVFVTGGSGFVGGALVRRLVDGGRHVKALVRSETAEATVRSLGAEPVRGDLQDRRALLEAMRGADTVFHVAAVNRMCVRDPAILLRANVDGSENVVRAAAETGVARVVFTSSAATIGESEGVVARETTAHRGSFLSSYERSKTLAERRVLAVGRELGSDVVCVNPSSVHGPGRTHGSSRLLLDLVRGRLPVLVETYLSVVDIEDCTNAHLLAEAKGVPGTRYLVNGASLDTRTAVAVLRRVWGRPERVRFVPRWVATAAIPPVGLAARFARDEPTLCPQLVRTLLHGHRYDGSLATRELGLAYTPLEDTVRRTLTWYAEQGLGPPPLPHAGADG